MPSAPRILLATLLLAASASAQTPPADFEARIDDVPLVPNADLTDPAALAVDEVAFEQTFTHRRVPVDGRGVHVVTGGEGPPVLLLHGWPTSWYEWRRVMPLLAGRYTVVVPDLPGVGLSDRLDGPHTKRAVGRAMLALMTALDHDRFYLVGHDWGTSTAFAMATLAPDRVDRLVLTENTVPGLDVPGYDEAGETVGWDAFNARWWHHQFHAQPTAPELLVTGREREYLDSKFRAWTYNYDGAFTEDYLDAFTEAYTRPGALTAGFDYYRALDRDAEDNRGVVAERGARTLPMPLLVVTARYQVDEALHRQLLPVAADYRGAIVDDAQHFLMIEAPATLARLVDEFLQDGSLAVR